MLRTPAMSSSGCRGRTAVALEECVEGPRSCCLVVVDRAGLSSMELMCESLVHCPCPLPASSLPWVGPPLCGHPASVRHLGLGRFPRGLFTAPASVCVVSEAGKVAASSLYLWGAVCCGCSMRQAVALLVALSCVRMSLALTCGTPVKTTGLAEPEFTGDPWGAPHWGAGRLAVSPRDPKTSREVDQECGEERSCSQTRLL